MMLAANLTVDGYNLVRRVVNGCGQKALPSYHQTLKAKQRCYPETATVTPTQAEVTLQALLDHTPEGFRDI